MKVLISALIGVFAVAAILSGVLLYQNWSNKNDDSEMSATSSVQKTDTPAPQNTGITAKDTSKYELILTREVQSGDSYPQVGYSDCLVVKLMPEDEPIQADSIETDEVLLTLCDKLKAYSVLLSTAYQNMDRKLIDDIPGLMGTEEAILTERIKNDIIIAMRNLELKAARAVFDADIIKYKYGQITKETMDASAEHYLAAVGGTVSSLESLQGMD